MSDPLLDQTSLPDQDLVLRTPSEVIEAVPYILGFHPERSLVIVCMGDEPRRLKLVLRGDLESVLEDSEFPRVATHYLIDHKIKRIVVLIYTGIDQDRKRLPYDNLISALTKIAGANDVRLHEALCIGKTRWWSYLCAEAACCPEDGIRLPVTSKRTSPLAAAAAYAGMVALPNRDALKKLLEPVPNQDQEELSSAIDQAEAALVKHIANERTASSWRKRAIERLNDAIERCLRDPKIWLETQETADLLVAVLDPFVRDEAATCDEKPAAVGALNLWRQLARRADPPYDVGPLFLVAWVAWRTGQGPLARVAIDKALASDPANTAALLLEEVLDRGIDPAMMNRRKLDDHENNAS